ncbi:MAG: hypothetical protein ACKO2K_11185 [Alphaproteobacteria bacterium]
MPRSNPWKSLLFVALALGIGLLAAPSAQACLLDTDGTLDCSFSLRKAEAKTKSTVPPPAAPVAAPAAPAAPSDRWNAEGELNTLPNEQMPDDIDANGAGVSFGYMDSAGSSFIELDRVDFTGEECKAGGGTYRRVRCKTDGGLFVLSPRSALSFFKVIARMNKRTIVPFPNLDTLPLAVVVHSPEGKGRGDTIGGEVSECKYTASKQTKLTCRRLP